MGGTGVRFAKNPNMEKQQMSNSYRASTPSNRVLANAWRKIEQIQAEYCQYSEYLTLLSSFPDVKKSVRGVSHETKSRQFAHPTPSLR
jgi:hypothetical protein